MLGRSQSLPALSTHSMEEAVVSSGGRMQADGQPPPPAQPQVEDAADQQISSQSQSSGVLQGDIGMQGAALPVGQAAGGATASGAAAADDRKGRNSSKKGKKAKAAAGAARDPDMDLLDQAITDVAAEKRRLLASYKEALSKGGQECPQGHPLAAGWGRVAQLCACCRVPVASEIVLLCGAQACGPHVLPVCINCGPSVDMLRSSKQRTRPATDEAGAGPLCPDDHLL